MVDRIAAAMSQQNRVKRQVLLIPGHGILMGRLAPDIRLKFPCRMLHLALIGTSSCSGLGRRKRRSTTASSSRWSSLEPDQSIP